jgi:hypothetical protein
VAGERPHVTLTVDARSFAGAGLRDDGEAHPAAIGATEPGDAAAIRTGLDHVGPVGPDTARRITCDASLMRIVLSGRSEPLDVGRRTPVVPPGMRRALIVRDRGCRFPGCDRPHTWCDAHHIHHWADGGRTSLDNLVLLCRQHHRAVHADFRLESVEGRPVFRRSDGTILDDRAPPRAA